MRRQHGLRRARALPECFLEVHIEQGPVLERAGAPLGLAMGIVGIVRGERVFEGQPGHAGTVPMAGRLDALVAAAEYVFRVRDIASGAIDGAVATVGQVDVEPGAVNVIPGRVRVSVDARAPDRERLDRLVAELELKRTSGSSRCRWPQGRSRPSAPSSSNGAYRSSSCPRAPATTRRCSRARVFRRRCSSSAASNGGISHSPQEESSAEDVELAVEVLTGALARLTAGD